MSDINEMNVGLRWYVVHTYSGYENKVKANLEKIVENRGLGHLIYEVKVPTETIVTPSEKGDKIEEIKIFPCYVYVKMIMTDESWHAVRNITGVTGFVGPGSRPVPLTEREVDALSIEPKREAIVFAEGDKVEIFEGLFAGTEVEVLSVCDDEKNIKVLIPRGRRNITVEVPITSVRHLDR